MPELFEQDAPPGNAPEYTVSEISGAVKRTIEGEFSHLRVRGEVGRVSFPRSGHVYLDLKDDRCVLSGVIWRGVASRLTAQPEEGMEVVATGRLTTFGGQSKYQMVIDDIAPAGVGALMAMLEKRKKALAAEGLFDAARKRPLPYLPEVIGVVTSPSGAVIRDILHRLRDRFPRKVLIWPVAVQGPNCAPEVVRAIEGFNRLTPGGALPRPDLLIVARGGGSIEDLWGFNEEAVARAAAASDIPLISAVGHETDTTLIDFASDRRAPTPTAAAELAVPVRLELLAQVEQAGARLGRCATQAVIQRRQRLRDLARSLPRLDSLTQSASQRLDNAAQRLPNALQAAVQLKKVDLGRAAGPLRPGLLGHRLRRETDRLTACGKDLRAALERGRTERRNRLEQAARGLRPHALLREVERRRDRLDQTARRLHELGERMVPTRRDRLQNADRLRQTLGYRETLARGFAVVRDGAQILKSRTEAAAHPHMEIEFHDGRLAVSASGGGGPAAGAPSGSGTDGRSESPRVTGGNVKTGAPDKKRKSEPPAQGDLF